MPCEYNLGVMLARSLHLVVRRNTTDSTPIYAGAIATLVYEHIKEERGFDDNMGTLVRESNLLDFSLTDRMEISIRRAEYVAYCYKSSNGQSVSIRLPRADLFDRTSGKWTVEEAPPQEEPQNQAPEVIHGDFMSSSQEGTEDKNLPSFKEAHQVVDMVTIRDTSLIPSLGEYFSPFPFCCFIPLSFCYVLVIVLKIMKTQKYFICFFSVFTSGHLLYAFKNQKDQKHFRFLETNAKNGGAGIAEICSPFDFSYFFCNSD